MSWFPTATHPPEVEGLSRRNLMACGAGLAAALSLAPRIARSAGVRRAQADLFAFTAPDQSAVVFAVGLAPQPFGQVEHDPLLVRLHAGATTWTVGPHALQGSIRTSAQGARIFTGPVRSTTTDGAGAVHLIAVAAPPRQLPPSPFDVWAEVIGANGERMRIGNPVVARLLFEDDHLAELHRQSVPATDRQHLSQALVRRIALREDQRLDAQSSARAERLAARLLPDTLRFDASRPGGFTFAAMNGRRPGDTIDPVVRTVLAGAPRAGGAAGSYAASPQFPYFASTAAA